MAVIVADTDVLIDFLSNQGPGAEKVASTLEAGDLTTTVVTRFELLVGAKSERRERAVQELLSLLPILDLDSAASDLAATIQRSLDRQGLSIGMADSLIAGIVLRHGGVLLTRNRRHFERIGELSLADL